MALMFPDLCPPSRRCKTHQAGVCILIQYQAAEETKLSPRLDISPRALADATRTSLKAWLLLTPLQKVQLVGGLVDIPL